MHRPGSQSDAVSISVSNADKSDGENDSEGQEEEKKIEESKAQINAMRSEIVEEEKMPGVNINQRSAAENSSNPGYTRQASMVVKASSSMQK